MLQGDDEAGVALELDEAPDDAEEPLCLVYEAKRVAVPWAVLCAVFARYGREKAPEVRLADDAPRLPLGDGRALVHLRHRARYDVIARDFLVLERPGEPPLVELSTAIAAALVHLAEATR